MSQSYVRLPGPHIRMRRKAQISRRKTAIKTPIKRGGGQRPRSECGQHAAAAMSRRVAHRDQSGKIAKWYGVACDVEVSESLAMVEETIRNVELNGG